MQLVYISHRGTPRAVQKLLLTMQASKLAANTLYRFRARDFSEAGAGEYSRIVTATTPPAPLSTPTLTCTLASSCTEAILEWRGQGADTYEVQASTDGAAAMLMVDGRPVSISGDFARVWLGEAASVAVGLTSVPPNSTLHFRVRCRGTKDTMSPFSSLQSVHLPAPAAPLPPPGPEPVQRATTPALHVVAAVVCVAVAVAVAALCLS